jgi:hypothetical protein
MKQNKSDCAEKVTIHGSGMRIYCAFRMNMIQVRGDFCRAKLSISPRTVTMSGSKSRE